MSNTNEYSGEEYSELSGRECGGGDQQISTE